MKKILLHSLLAASAITLLGACASEEADIFDQSAAERLNEAKETFTKRLSDSPNGWIFEYFGSTETDADNYVKDMGYLMMVNLRKDGSLVAGMKNYHSGYKYWEDESLWEVITDMSAVLSFNSYNQVIHRFSEPENYSGSTSYGGDIGKGMLGDYEFIIVDAPEGGDHIMLKGKKHGGYSRLTRLSADDGTFEEYIDDVTAMKSEILSEAAPNHYVMSIGEKQYYFIMPNKGGELGLTKLWPAGTDSTFTMVLNPLILTRQNIDGQKTYVVRFRDEIKGSDDETTVQEFYYDPATQSFRGEGENVSIVGEEPAHNFFELFAKRSTYSFIRQAEGSDRFKQVVEDVCQGLAGVKYKVDAFALKAVDNAVTFKISYKDAKSKKGTLTYNYTWSQNGDALVLTYVGADDNPSSAAQQTIPALVDLCNILAGTFNISAGNNALNLSTLKFTNSSDPTAEFILNYEKAKEE